LVGEHKGGYTAFTFDISKLVTIPGRNIIAIKVNNSRNMNLPPISGDYTMFGGIYRDVYLISTEALHFDQMNLGSNGIFIETPLVNEKSATVKVKGAIVNESAESKKVVVLSKIIDKSGNIVTEIKTKLKLNAGAKQDFEQISGSIAKPNLWSTDMPYLYTVQTKLLSDDKSAIEYELINNPLGFRWFSFNPS
jgi:beta-galactosidase